MGSNETYNGYTNSETWAVALHINNDQAWQESVHEALRNGDYGIGGESFTLAEAREAYYNSPSSIDRVAGEIIRENVEQMLYPITANGAEAVFTIAQWGAMQDIGSLWRVNWTELGALFLEELEEADVSS